jgi:hypothetical protein
MLSMVVAEKLLENIHSLAIQKYTNLSKLFDLAVREDRFIVSRVDGYDWLHGPSQDDVARFNALHDELRGISVRGLFSDLENLERSLFPERSDRLLPPEFYSHVSKYITNITGALEQYLGRRGDNFLLYILFQQVSRLVTSIEDIQGFSYVVSGLLSDLFDEDLEAKIDENKTKNLTIYLGSRVLFSRFVLKLDAINTIYNELAQIMNISVEENPIIIKKVESGSSWLDIFGYPKIIAMIERLMDNTIDYFYRNFTREGKIVALPRNVEALESVLEMRKQLKAIGVDTGELDDLLNKSAVVIATRLNTLLLGEARVSINARERFIGNEFEAKYLEASKTLLLTEGTDYKEQGT